MHRFTDKILTSNSCLWLQGSVIKRFYETNRVICDDELKMAFISVLWVFYCIFYVRVYFLTKWKCLLSSFVIHGFPNPSFVDANIGCSCQNFIVDTLVVAWMWLLTCVTLLTVFETSVFWISVNGALSQQWLWSIRLPEHVAVSSRFGQCGWQ